MKKRGFSLLLAILILAAQIPFAFAANKSGTWGDNVSWTLEDNGTLTVRPISGKAAIPDFKANAPWREYADDVVNVVVGDGITYIGMDGFCSCNNLQGATMSDSVVEISSGAFLNCSKLTDITLSDRLTSIGDGAFHNCYALAEITIPNSVTSIGEQAFEGCNSLIKITIPNSVTSIGHSAFSACTNLADVTISDSITKLERSTFFSCTNLTNITIPESIISIGWGTFALCDNLKNVYYGGTQSQWESINFEPSEYGIGDSNDNLKNAAIHYNSSGLDSEPITPPAQPVTPTPVEPAPQTNEQLIHKYSYAFSNESRAFSYPLLYRFPLERFQLIYGDDFAKKMKAIDFGGGAYWSGNCYGLATTAAMLARAGSGVTAVDFRSGASRPGELQVSDTNSKWGLTLTQFIEAMQISQYSATFATTRKQNRNQLSSLLSAMSAFEEGGFGPLVICVYGEDRNGNYSGHALLAYHLDGQRLYVYDCNYPNDGNRYITISENRWSYPIFNDVIWSNSNNGEITYIQYETYLMDWYNRGSVLGDPEQLKQVAFFINAADAVISDSYGNEVATFRKGKMVSGIDEAFPIPQLGVTADGVSAERPQISVWLPYTDEYKVTTQENATVSMVNVSKGVSTNNVTGGQTVSISLSSSTQPQFDDVIPGQYFYEPVAWAVERGITNGTTATTFSPQNTCSRNHILTFLWRANGSPASLIDNPFEDVDVSKDFGKAAVWGYERGLVSGKRFNGGTPCSRADVVTYLWKLAGHPAAGRSAFTDVPSNADYAQAVSWAVGRGITKGTSDTTFNPSAICTRGQIVTFLYRAYAQN